jgi:hypothetical protein
MTLTERDKAVLRWTGANGVATVAQLTAKFWAASNQTNCVNRLRMLVKAGWLESHYVDFDRHLRGLRVFCLTSAGARQHFSAAEIRTMMVGLPARSILKQQILAQQARLEIEKQLASQGFTLVEWQNESMLRSQLWQGKTFGQAGKVGGGIGDAQIKIVDKNGEISSLVIEIDGLYYRKILEQRMSDYINSGISVLWVTYSSNRLKRLEHEISVRNAHDQMYAIYLPMGIINAKSSIE